ncbi:MAG TPA: malto-oligosyltrehalose trehalohydrolase [Mycobacteriales bacterium]|nr:malto-oligosyltrehalose trehalohydrolase [Mycobacteriales bacterium]
MTSFRVWAPFARERVELDALGRRWPMERDGERGWWSLDVPDAGPGTDYRFVLDGGEPLPDPRSRWQPAGVSGASRVVDLATLPWTDADWRGRPLADGVVYELHIGTFSAEGTFDGAIERLDHLVDLGVTHVEVMPVAQFSGDRGWGYDGVDLFAVHHAYGGPEGFARFVDACHARGLAVILDVVYNHLGPAGNYLDRFGPYFTDRYRTPWGTAVNYDDAGSDEVRELVVDNALMWLRDYHCDGLRLDAVHAIFDQSARHLLEELQDRVDELATTLGRPLDLVAESDLNDPRLVSPREPGGYALSAQWSDDFHHALHATLTGERSGYYTDFDGISSLATALRRVFVYAGEHSPYRERRHGRPVGSLPATRFIGYLQNHDQVGNRATGDRSSHLLSTGLLQVGAALVLLGPFVPMLFQGEEWGASAPFQYFTDHGDPDLADAVRTGRRSEFAAFGWRPEEVPDPQARETFERSRLDWAELDEEPHRTLLEWHRALIALRHATPQLRDGDLATSAVELDADAGWLVLRRDPLEVVVNTSKSPVVAPLASGRRVVELSSAEVTLRDDAVELPGESVAVLRHLGP